MSKADKIFFAILTTRD